MNRGSIPRMVALLIPLAVLASLGGCSWVSLTPSGERVRVLQPEEVGACERVGKTTATTKASVIGIGRSYLDIVGELENLARNAAEGMGGDTVVAESPVVGGTRTFGVYRCVGTVGRSGGGASPGYAPAVTRPLPP